MKFILLFLLVVPTVHAKKYKRHDWHHWSDVNHNCRNTRQEILVSRSLSAVSFNRKGCTVVRGQWKDYYYPQELTSSRAVDIDHLIPLKHAHDVGGENWTRAQKEMFANDPENLVITNKAYNRKKGAKTIAEWLPVHKDYACKYIKDWIRLKKKYNLPLLEIENKTITLSKCL